MRRAVLMILLAALALGVSGPTTHGQDKTKYPVLALEGKKAPGFTSDFALNGDKASLTDFKGKVVLLDFWAVWCGPCRAVFPDLKRLHETYGKQGVEVVGITRYYGKTDFKDGKLVKADPMLNKNEEQGMLERFVKANKLPYRILASPEAMKAYKITGIPTAVLIDKKGKVRMVKIGANKDGIEALEDKIKDLLAER